MHWFIRSSLVLSPLAVFIRVQSGMQSTESVSDDFGHLLFHVKFLGHVREMESHFHRCGDPLFFYVVLLMHHSRLLRTMPWRTHLALLARTLS